MFTWKGYYKHVLADKKMGNFQRKKNYILTL